MAVIGRRAPLLSGLFLVAIMYHHHHHQLLIGSLEGSNKKKTLSSRILLIKNAELSAVQLPLGVTAWSVYNCDNELLLYTSTSLSP